MSDGIGVSVRGLSKEFVTNKGGIVLALDDVSLEIAPRRFFVVVGPSGCGKTTLLRILAGLESAGGGEVAIHGGQDVRRSMVFQQESVFPWMTVWENAAYGLRMRRASKAETRERVDYYLDKTGLTAFADAHPHQLSGGMKQRVSLCRAFANDPDLMLMDEPFSALDEQNKMLLHEELLRIWQETAKTVVFITHSVDEAVTLGDEIMVMSANPGRAKAIATVPFDRPRDIFALRRDPAYGEFVYDIWGLLRDEAVTASHRSDEG
jgi:NitT/TauT family transport system ATP-binding protein